MAASKRNWSPLLATSPSPYVERTKQRVRQAALNESRSSVRNEALLRDVEILEQRMNTSAAETKQLDVLKRQYLEYVSSVYPHWVEQVALCKEKERIMGHDAPPLRAEATTRLPHPADHQVRGRGTRDTPRHTDPLPPPLPTLPPGAGSAQKQDPTVEATEWPPSVPSKSTGQHMLLGSHSEVGGAVDQAPPPRQGGFHPPFPGTEQSSHTTSVHNAEKATSGSSLVSQVQLPTSTRQNGTTPQEFKTMPGAGAQSPAFHQFTSSVPTQDLSGSSTTGSSLSMEELHRTPNLQSCKKADVSEPPGLSCSQPATQPVPSSERSSNTGSSCSPTLSNASSTTSCKGSAALSGNLEAGGEAPALGGSDEPVAVAVGQKTEDKSYLSDEESLSEGRQTRESTRLEVASFSNSSLEDELCGEDSVVPSVTSPPPRHGDNHVEPNLTILDIISPQESNNIQNQKPSSVLKDLKSELEPYDGAQDQVTADQQSNINRASNDQGGSLLRKEEELLDEDNSGDDSFWDMEPGAVAVGPSLPALDSKPPAIGETDQSKLSSKDGPPQSETGRVSERSKEGAEPAQSSLLSENSGERHIKGTVVRDRTAVSDTNKEMSAANAGDVVVDPEGGDVPTPTGGRDQDKSQATKPTAIAHISSTGEENSSRGRKARDGKQGSISGSLKKKLGFWMDSDSESEVDLSAMTPGGGESGDNDDFDFYT